MTQPPRGWTVMRLWWSAFDQIGFSTHWQRGAHAAGRRLDLDDVGPEPREHLGAARPRLVPTLLNDILDFSKIEAGRLDLERIPFAPRDALGGALKTRALRRYGGGGGGAPPRGGGRLPGPGG